MIPFAFARSENNIPQIAEMCAETGHPFLGGYGDFRLSL